jgi:hypothetical protein
VKAGCKTVPARPWHPAEVRPYNRRRRARTCTDDLILLKHRIEAQVNEPGLVVLRVVGEQRGASTGSGNTPAWLELDIVVQ